MTTTEALLREARKYVHKASGLNSYREGIAWELLQRIDKALSAAPVAAPVAWQPINTAPKLRKVLVYYQNSHKKGRTILARFVPRFTEESNNEECDVDEYNEEMDGYFLREGWYEQIDNWDDYTEVFVSETPTHWMPLPAPHTTEPT